MKLWIKYLITLAIGLLFAGTLCITNGLVTETDPVKAYKVLADAFTVPGVLLVCVGLLQFCVSHGAFYGIDLSLAGKGQLDVGFRRGIGVFGTKHGIVSGIAAGFAVKRVRDGIKNRGLARSGFAGDQVKTAGAQARKVQNLFARVRSKS